MPRDSEDPAERRERHRQQRLEERQALYDTQAENADLQQQLEELTNKVTELEQEHANPVAQDPANTDNRRMSVAERKAIAASVGRRAAVMHVPFMDSDWLFDHRVHTAFPRLLADVKKASLDPDDPEFDDDADELADADNPKKYWDFYRIDFPDPLDVVRELLFNMPPRATKWWFKEWFKESFQDGYRKIRADIAFQVAKNHALIFGITDVRFRKKELRVTMPEVNELRKAFQYRPLLANPTKFDPKSVFRHPCILKTIRYILSGESAISTGFRSKKARNAHSELWHVNQVTPSLIAFAAMIIDFVLSGEASLERSSANKDYLRFWQGRFEFFDDLYERHPRILDDLMMFHNRSALPHLFPLDADAEGDEPEMPQPHCGLTQEDMLALENMA